MWLIWSWKTVPKGWRDGSMRLRCCRGTVDSARAWLSTWSSYPFWTHQLGGANCWDFCKVQETCSFLLQLRLCVPISTLFFDFLTLILLACIPTSLGKVGDTSFCALKCAGYVALKRICWLVSMAKFQFFLSISNQQQCCQVSCICSRLASTHSCRDAELSPSGGVTSTANIRQLPSTPLLAQVPCQLVSFPPFFLLYSHRAMGVINLLEAARGTATQGGKDKSTIFSLFVFFSCRFFSFFVSLLFPHLAHVDLPWTFHVLVLMCMHNDGPPSFCSFSFLVL